MGGTKGFNIIYPEKIIENKTIPAILITDFKLFDKSVKPGIGDSPLNQSITMTKSITLTHAQSVLTFTFAVMDFSAPEKNQFAYMLENFDRDWIYPGNIGEATYTNLNPGHYILHVKGSNNDGLWNQTGTSLNITILPPWYGTLWFRIITVIGIILFISLIFVLRLSSLRKHKLKLEETVALKTLELKELNSSKDKFFSIIAHDLKHPFNTIIGFSRLLRDEAETREPDKIQEIAAIINNSAVQTFRLLENLLEWANAQRKKVTFIPVQIDLRGLMEEEFPTLNNSAADKNIGLRSTIPENIILYADRNMIRTIIRNLISNAIKFTNRNGKVEISALEINNTVEISISDTGVGMSEEIISKLFRIDGDVSTKGTENEKGTGLGLFLCKEFVDQHSGKIIVESNPGIGSVFKIVFPSGKRSAIQAQANILK
jgi:signal transduction histidine kinase